MRRRDFLTLLGGAAAAWPLAARAQQGERVRLIAVASQSSESDPNAQANIAAFRRRLADLGWFEGRNVRFDIRWGATDVQRRRALAAGLVALAPDVILATGAVVVEPLQELTRSIPIVFAATVDPVGGGLVASLVRPGGNTPVLLRSNTQSAGNGFDKRRELMRAWADYCATAEGSKVIAFAR